MTKRYIFKSLLIGIIFVSLTSQVGAQMAVKPASSDSIAVSVDKFSPEIPGQLFNVSKNNSTGAVSTVSGETLYKTAAPNLTNTLTGRLSGLTVIHGSGEPGYDNANMGIRGIGTYALAGSFNNFKIFVDGFEVYNNYFNYIAPDEIESFSILKDAASLAQFGMRGANGVIWVVTKRGKTGKPQFTFHARSGFQNPVVINKPLDSYNYASLYNQAISNDKGNVWTPKYSAEQLQSYQDGTGTNVDWYSKALKSSGLYKDGSLDVSGGDSLTKYSVVLNYTNQQGLFDIANTDSTSNEKFSRYSLRTNLDFKILRIFDAKVDFYTRLEDRKSPNYTTSTLFNDLANYPANIYPVYDLDNVAHYSGTSIYPNNPAASVAALGWRSSRRRFLQANFSLREKLNFITPGLYLDEKVSFISYSATNYNKTRDYARFINGATTTTNLTSSLVASSMSPAGQDDWKQGKIMLGYDRQFGASHIQSAIEYFISTELGEGLFSYQIHNEAINGRTNYSYKNKYVAEFGFSYYGSDNFRPGNQWGFYPALSAAWVVSNEDFLNANSILTYLKIRGSAGKTGTSESAAGNGIGSYNSAGRYLYQQYYAGSGSFYTGNTTPAGQGNLNPLFVANPDIFAEQSMKYNIGAELTLLKKLNINVDAYMDKRSNIPTIDNTTPSTFGNNIIVRNIGRMTSKGIDADLSFSDRVGDFGYALTGMASFNRNTIDYRAEVPPAYSYNAYTGRPIGTPIGLVASGFYQTEDFSSDGKLNSDQAVPFFGKVQAGDIKYADLNGDQIIDQTDVTSIGKSVIPEFNYSLGGNVNYNGFDLSVFLQGASGASVNILSSANTQVEAFTNNGNAFAIAQGAWAYYPEQGIDTRATATYPRLTTVTNINNYRTSSFWIKNNDYLRIRNVELGYTLNSSILERISLSKFRIYINAVNPITWSKLLKDYNMDPETLSGYPTLKSFNMGFSATF